MEEGPRLGRLRLNKCKGNRQDIVVPILGHRNQQNPTIFPIQVGPVDGNEVLAVLECLDARGTTRRLCRTVGIRGLAGPRHNTAPFQGRTLCPVRTFEAPVVAA
ncbi:hypothetical protein PIB30_091342, partial [Stylosanthes scabra]|nr:hypothetical protein [Stylosanthes scabra]